MTGIEIKQRRGDWICSACSTLVFSRKDECFKCRTPKSGSHSSNGGSGSWQDARGGGGSKHIQIQLNKDLLVLAKSGDGVHLCALVVERLLDFDAVNAATAYRSLLLTKPVRDAWAHNEALTSLERVLRDQHVKNFGARECANTLHSLAKAEDKRPCADLIRALESRALVVQGGFTPQNIASTLWAFATLGHQPEDALVAGLTVRALEVQGDFNSQNIANTLWAFATLELQPEDALVSGLTARALEVLGGFKPQGIGNMLWAMAKLGLQTEDALLVGFTLRLLDFKGVFTPQEIANTLWAFATLGQQPEEALVVGLTAKALKLQDEFNPQDIANTLLAFATLGRQPGDALVVALTAQALKVQDGFTPQNITNMLWAFATQGRQPADALVAGLTARALAVQGGFNPQDIANTLWAFAALGRQPKDALIAGLTARVLELQDDFNSKNIAITLWAVCFLSIGSPDAACRLVCALEPRIAALAAAPPSDIESQRQMHQFVVACDVDEGLRAGVPASVLALKETWGPTFHATFVGGHVIVSRSQHEVGQTLRGMHMWVEDEVVCPRSGYSIDMWLHHSPVLQQSGKASWQGDKDGWAVEFDGPTHFLACRAPTGATLIKRHHLHLLGYTLVSVPYWEWARTCAQAGAREQYLRRKLQL